MNAKITKTRKALLDGLITLMEEEPVESITVSRLCECAGINRTTFYKYYSVPTDVILEAADEILMKTLNVKDVNGYDHLLMVCNAFYDNRKLMKLCTRVPGNLFQLFYTVIMRHEGELSFLATSENHFLAGGVASVLAAWMARDFDQTPEQIAQMLADYIQRLSI